MVFEETTAAVHTSMPSGWQFVIVPTPSGATFQRHFQPVSTLSVLVAVELSVHIHFLAELLRDS